MCLDQPRASNRAILSQAFPYENTILFSVLFLNDPIPGTPRHICTIVHPKHQASDLRAFDIKQNITLNIDFIRVPKRTGKQKETMSYYPRHGLEIYPGTLHTSYERMFFLRLCPRGTVFVFVSPKTRGLRKSKFPPTNSINWRKLRLTKKRPKLGVHAVFVHNKEP